MEKKRQWSISIKLWLAMTLLILTVLGGLGVVITWLFGDFYFQQKLDALRSEAVETSEQLSEVPNWTARILMLETLKLTSGTQLALLDSQGNILAMGGTSGTRGGMNWGGVGPGMGFGGGPMGNWGRNPKITDFLSPSNLSSVLEGNTLSIKAMPKNGDEMAMLIAAAPLGSNPVQGVVLLGTSSIPLQESINTFRRIIIYASFAAILLAMVVSLLFARQFTRPLSLMQKGARRMANGDFQPIVGVNSKDEIGELAEALNLMGEDLSNHMTWLSQEKNLLHGIVEGISDPVIMLGQDGDILYSNEPAKSLWEGKNYEQEERQKRIIEFVKTIVSQDDAEETSHTLKLGKQVLQVGIAPMTEAENVKGHVAVLRDITASLRAEKERRDFLASVTHELRTPLHLIQGYLEAMQDGVIPDEEKNEHIDLVLEEAGRLARLVQDLQDMNRFERGAGLNLQVIGIESFFQDLKQLFQAQAQELGISLQFPKEKDLQIMADRDRFSQVFINLLDNALRHTPSGKSVYVNVESYDDKVRFAVQDEGEGIPEDSLPKVFESFYRVDKARSRKEGGMGLGLAIVKQIVEAHGGRVYVESELAKGSTFWVEWPVNKFF